MKKCINPECNAELEDNAKFCAECGTPQPTEVQSPTGGMSIGDNNAISAHDIIGGDSIKAENYIVNNVMAAEKTEDELKIEKISVKKASKDYFREEMNIAKEYERKEDYYHAVSIYRDLAEDDNLDAVCAILKLDYDEKYKVPQDLKESLYQKVTNNINSGHAETLFFAGLLMEDSEVRMNYITQAYEKGSVCATEILFNMFLEDNNPKDGYFKNNDVSKELFKLFEKASDLNNPIAQYCIAECYYYGKFVKQDYIEAVKWYTESAGYTYDPAMSKLGECYYLGHGVTQDYEKAMNQWRLMTDISDKDVFFYIGECYYNGWGGVEKDLEESVKWFRKAAEQNHAKACYYVGEYYACDDNTLNEAIPWFEKGTELGDYECENWLASCYYEMGEAEKAVVYFKDIIENCNEYVMKSLAMQSLGECYLYGKGVEQDDNKALELFHKTEDTGFSANKIGDCYYFGYGVEKDYKEAVKWYKKAADRNDIEAEYNLGNCYYLGNGVETNDDEARKWLTLAAERGHKDAKELLDDLNAESPAPSNNNKTSYINKTGNNNGDKPANKSNSGDSLITKEEVLDVVDDAVNTVKELFGGFFKRFKK